MKKYIRTLKIGAAAFVLLIASSCDNFLDDNLSPNQVTSAPPGQLLASVVGQFGFHMGGSDLYRYAGIWSQQITAQAARQTQNYSLYNLSDTEVNGVWRGGLYAGVLSDVEELLKSDPATTHPRYYGIAKVIKAFTYSQLVDFWGDVPFSEAMQYTSNFQPAVDDDAAIYPQLITMLDEAIVDLKVVTSNPATPAPGTQDFIYSSNAARWIKAANVLKLRLYLKMANTPGFNNTTITTFLATTPVTELFESNADDMQHPFTASLSGRQNPTHQFILSRTDDICTSSTIINLMNGKSDPRRVNYFTPAPFDPTAYATPPTGTTGYKGLQPGTGQSAVDNSLSRLHRFVRGAVTTATIPPGPNLTVSTTGTSLAYDGGSSTNILTYAEYNFMRAEIALRYTSPADPVSAELWYREGIRTSILDASHPARPLLAADATAYLALNGTLNVDPAIALRQIIEEKYVANFMVTGEPWSDWRRTGYPLLQLLPGTLNPGNNNRVPRSVVYPQQEVNANPNMNQKADMSVRVFWDTRTTGQE